MENNISMDLGLPCIFIRYNPDKKYSRFGKILDIKTKLTVLKSYIDYYTSLNNFDPEINFMFY